LAAPHSDGDGGEDLEPGPPPGRCAAADAGGADGGIGDGGIGAGAGALLRMGGDSGGDNSAAEPLLPSLPLTAPALAARCELALRPPLSDADTLAFLQQTPLR
jgi:hypothetical protein